MECPQDDLTCAPWAKCFVNGPLPCSNSLSGNIFLFVIYSFLIMCGVKLVNDSGESLLRLVNSDSTVGRPVVALFVPVLHVLPELLIVLFASADSFQPQEQLWIAIGTIVGGIMFWLTLGWGLIMFVGRSDIVSGEALDGKLSATRDLVNTGVTVDLNARQVAGIMTVTVSLFIIAQVTDFVFRHESLQDMANSQHIYMLISGILCIGFYLGFTAYLFLNSSLQHRHLREARRRRRVDEAKARFVDKLDQVPLEQWLALADRELPQNWEHEVESLESTSLQTGTTTEVRERIHNSAQLTLASRVVVLLLAGLLFLGLFTNPLVDTIMKFFRQNTDNTEVSVRHLQFYVSCFLLPFITNSYRLFENLTEAQHRQRKTISLIVAARYLVLVHLLSRRAGMGVCDRDPGGSGSCHLGRPGEFDQDHVPHVLEHLRRAMLSNHFVAHRSNACLWRRLVISHLAVLPLE